MGDKLNVKQTQKKLNSNGVPKETKCSSDQHPFFSFRYMTANKHYNAEYLDDKNDDEHYNTLQGIYSALEKISSSSWTHWINQRKENGLETMEYSRLNFKADGMANLTGDEKVYIFRIDTHDGNGKGRIIGFKSSPCAAFNVIGYDFDFSAYPH